MQATEGAEVPEQSRPDPEAVKAYVDSLDFTDCEQVRMPAPELDGPMRKAIVEALPAGAGMCFNYDGDQAVVTISRPGDTRRVVAAARHSLGRSAIRYGSVDSRPADGDSLS